MVIFFIAIFSPISFVYAVLSCSLSTSVGCSSGVVVLRMSGADNAQAEIPSMSTAVYDDNVICCTGVPALGNSCSGNYEVIARLSGTSGTNAHVEKNDQTNINYNNQKICLSSTYAGDQISIGYQTNNCTGFDTTLFSMTNTPTNSMVGSASSYANKVCAKIVTQSISFNISDYSIGFGSLISTGLRFATGDGVGSDSETEAYFMTVNTNAPSGYSLFVKGETLVNGAYSITPIGGTNLTPNPGTKAFGMRAVATGGVGSVVYPYDGSGFAYDATSTTASSVATASTGDGVTTNYSVRTVATIDEVLNYGLYSTNLTYIVVPNF